MASSLEITPALGHGIVTAQDQPGGYDAIDDRRQWGVGRQEGALAALAYKVTPKSEGANLSVDVATDGGHFLVQGDDVDWQGLYLIPATALKANLDLADTPDITNPRLDQVVLEARDHAHTGDGITRGQVYVLSGTPTAGATLDNRSGAAALPASTALLADVLVPAGATSITSAEIRDRRPFAAAVTYDLSAASSLDIPVDSDAESLLLVEFELECSALGNVRLRPNNDGSPVYSDIRDGSYLTSAPAANAIAAVGTYNQSSGLILATAPVGAASGGQNVTGRAHLGLAGQGASNNRRLCVAHAAVNSDVGSGNHAIQVLQIASLWSSSAVIRSVRLDTSSGTMTGRVRVQRV